MALILVVSGVSVEHSASVRARLMREEMGVARVGGGLLLQQHQCWLRAAVGSGQRCTAVCRLGPIALTAVRLFALVLLPIPKRNIFV